MFVYFFKCSSVLRVGAVIFELDEASISSFVEFEFIIAVNNSNQSTSGSFYTIPSMKISAKTRAHSINSL